MVQERRRGRRYELWLPMRLEPGGERTLVAMSKNLSRSGVLMASAEALAPGAEVTLRVVVPSGGEERHLSACESAQTCDDLTALGYGRQ